MGLFIRLTDIVTANLNALLDRVENPERMLGQIIREMEDGLSLARQQAALVIASERRLERELEKAREAATTWQTRARLALDHEREDLARRALARHLEQLDAAKALTKQLAAAEQTSANVQAMVQSLTDRLDQARQRQRRLHAQREAVEIRGQALAAAGQGNPRSPFARFARLENRLNELEDDLLAYATLVTPSQQFEAELHKLETDARVATALAALKQGKG